MLPKETTEFGAVILMLVRADAVTVKVAVPLTVPEVAVMVADPGATAFANPELLTVAMVLSELVQVRFFGFTVLPSSLVPVAVNCWVPATATVADIGEIVTLTGTGVRVVDTPVQPMGPKIVIATPASHMQDARWSIVFRLQPRPSVFIAC